MPIVGDVVGDYICAEVTYTGNSKFSDKDEIWKNWSCTFVKKDSEPAKTIAANPAATNAIATKAKAKKNTSNKRTAEDGGGGSGSSASSRKKAKKGAQKKHIDTAKIIHLAKKGSLKELGLYSDWAIQLLKQIIA